MKELLKLVCYGVAAPFSKVSSAKMRWLLENHEWETFGIAQTDMRRKVYIVPRTAAVCVTVSKCANTTLKYMLYPGTKAEPKHVHADDHMLTRLIDVGMTLNDLIDGSRPIFTFVRHPVDRFWSSYVTQVISKGDRADIVRDISRHMGIAARPDYPPELVLDYVMNVSPLAMDEHLRPLWSCTGIERLPIDFIGRVESMNEDVMKLVDMGFFDEEHVRRFKHLNRSNKPEIPDKTRIDKIIRDVYAKDMELFGYD